MPQINLWSVIIGVRQQPEEKSQAGWRLSPVCLQQDYSHGSQERLTREDGLLGVCLGLEIIISEMPRDRYKRVPIKLRSNKPR